MSATTVHSFYHIWFTTIDPLVLFLSVLACIFSPAAILETSIPPSIASYDPLSHGPLLYQSAALYAFLAIIFGVLLRISDDLKVWRVVQFATLIVDISLLVTMGVLLEQQGRLDMGEWRSGDWFNAGFTVWVAIIRGAFLAGIGVGDGDREKVKRG